MTRRRVRVEHAAVWIDQQIRIPRKEIGTDVSGPACVYAHVQIERGAVAYLQGEAQMHAPRRFAIFLPPFAVVQARLARCDVTTACVAFRPPASITLPPRPLLLSAASDLPLSVGEVLERLRHATGTIDVGRALRPSLLASQAKAILDAEYHTSLAIARIASRLRVAPALLSRTFGRSFGMAPVRYRHHVRIIDALLRLAEGSVPVEVFQDVGFNDLGRFYKIFRKVACAPPGSYRPARSRNAKT